MPSIVAHYICGKLVAKKLNIVSNEYIKGNLYPDYIDVTYHYRIAGKRFEIPNIDEFIKENNPTNNYFKLGFLTHLILDKLYLDDFVLNDIYSKIDNQINIFEEADIYNDYTIISTKLLNNYNFNLDEIDNLMLREKNINITKYKKNIEVIRKNKDKNLKYLNTQSFIHFLNEAADKISEYIITNKYYN